ncbi:MAG: GH36-type glycosyl hydrolase domain-containing protein [Hyphomicrobiales bacterium]
MPPSDIRTTPRDGDLGLTRIANRTGVAASVLPNGSVFAIEHVDSDRRIMINQVLGSPIDRGIGCLYARVKGRELVPIMGYGAVRVGASDDVIEWAGETALITYRATLELAEDSRVWFWRIAILNMGDAEIECDALLLQDVGLGERGFIMNNEAYASQYIDHFVDRHGKYGPVVMSRQNLAQRGAHPWIAHGCLEGAPAFATDALQSFGTFYRDRSLPAFGLDGDLPAERRQHEVACVGIQSRLQRLPRGGSCAWTFFALYEPDHPDVSSESDLARLEVLDGLASATAPRRPAVSPAARTLVEDAVPLLIEDMSGDWLDNLYPVRLHEERRQGALLSFFVPDGAHNRHIVLAAKERVVTRRHGTLLRSGSSVLPDEETLCTTCWMHGVFAAQLTIGNTALHKVFSVSRDPYNITRASGMRMLADTGAGWRLLTVPSVFDIGLSDCRWIYRLADRTIIVDAVISGEDSAIQWQVEVEGPVCRFIVFAQIVMGEREFDHSSTIEFDRARHRLMFRPDPAWVWGRRYPDTQLQLVTSTPDIIEALGGDELLHEVGRSHGGGFVAFRTKPTAELRWAVVGSLRSPAETERLAAKYERKVSRTAMLEPAARFWTSITRNVRIEGDSPAVRAMDLMLPWLAHNAIIHLSVPHGLEQYTGGAWGTRDVCQGSVEFLLTLGHDETVRRILEIVFAQQYEQRGDWPQWFMLEPYSNIQDRHAHGDVIVWPLKALCDYVEATNDLGFLDEPVPWRGDDDFHRTERIDSVFAHVEKLIATARDRFIPGTHLLRYGEGDWNDSLQPVDPRMKDSMVSSWTAVLFFEQVTRYAEALRRAGHDARALQELAAAIRQDVNRYLIVDGVIAGYAVFGDGTSKPELLLHPLDRHTGLWYSLIPMTQAIIAGLFTLEQSGRHLEIIRDHLLFPDGARLMDRPVAYHGGTERLFRRAESAAFFGREIGLMYVHAHLRYAEALAVAGDAEGLWNALGVANPIAVTDILPNASLRQRNAYFSSSDAAYPDRYLAEAEWDRVKAGGIAVEGGWRIYSSGPGLYANMLLRRAFGRRRWYGEGVDAPLLPAAIEGTLRISSRPLTA